MSNALAEALLAWYDENKRDLPWRRERDPYRVWVSEIMLQQTRVETVIPYYERFVARFPTAAALAAASEDEVLTLWTGLGYYSRARNLHAGVREVVSKYAGVVPDDVDALGKLPGVGPYTAGAIASIAYDQPVPAVDGNVMRVLSRLRRLRADVRQPKSRRLFEAVARQLIPAERPGDFNQALMELGALVCRPGRPRCDACPLTAHCQAWAVGEQAQLPVRSRPARPVELEVACAIVEYEGRILLERRPATGLLASMWQFPTVELGPGQDPVTAVTVHVLAVYGLPVQAVGPVIRHTHQFTHRRWLLQAVPCRLLLERAAADVVVEAPGGIDSGDVPEWRWVTPRQLAGMAVAGPHLRVWAARQASAVERQA